VAPGLGEVANFFGCVGSDEVGGERLCSDEVGLKVSGSTWQGRWSVWLRQLLAGSEGFGSQLRKKFPFLLS
jgi:hypothetical protein